MSGTPRTTGVYVARWRLLVHSEKASCNNIVLNSLNGRILRSVSYGPNGQIHSQTNDSSYVVGAWTRDVSQLFEVTIDLERRVTSLSIDGTPVSNSQNIPIVEPEAEDFARIGMGDCTGYVAEQSLAWDDITIVDQVAP